VRTASAAVDDGRLGELVSRSHKVLQQRWRPVQESGLASTTVLSALHAPDLPQLGGPVSSSTVVGGEPSSLCSLASSSARLKNAFVSDSIWSGQTPERRASVAILYVKKELESCHTE